MNRLCTLGHVATTAELRMHGLTRSELARLRRDPAVFQPRQGRYACAHLSSEEVVAVGCGARLDCVSVLRAHGIWAGNLRGVHLRMPTSGGRTSQRSSSTRMVRHWAAARTRGTKTSMSVSDALRQAMACLPPDDLVAAIESAVHLRKLTRERALSLITNAPRRLRRVLGEIDTEFRAQSGYETKVRLRLTRCGYRVEPQARVPGVGHLDNLVEGVIAVETDGRQHELSVAEDRDRDLGTALWGIRVLRVDPALVDRDWGSIQQVVDRVVAEARELQRLKGRETGDTP